MTRIQRISLSAAVVVGAVVVVVLLLSHHTFRRATSASGNARSSSQGLVPRGVKLPPGVTLRQIDGGSHYYADIDKKSAWMDRHFMIGAWLEQPLTSYEVRDDVAMGNNIYWNLAGNPLDTKDCGGIQPCRVNFNTIRAAGMHASAPDVTSKSGPETVAYEGTDEPDLNFGAGANGWNPHGVYNQSSCMPAGSACGYTVAGFFYSGKPVADGSPGYPIGQKPITQGFGKAVLFWDNNAAAAKFFKYSDTLSADAYWMTDPDLDLPSQGACSLLPLTSRECDGGKGAGLTTAQRALPANYAFNVTRIEQVEALTGGSKPVTVDVETGCPGSGNLCTTPAAATAAAWHAIIAGARGIIWFQHNLGGPCVDFSSFYDGSNPASPMYKCQQTPGVTLHDVVENVSAFNHEVQSLNSVLLSPFADNYVSTSSDVSVMAKYTRGACYIFAGSGRPADPPANNLPVTFKVAGDYTGMVTVIGEHRTLEAVHGIFKDTFANEDSVHIYEIKNLGQRCARQAPNRA